MKIQMVDPQGVALDEIADKRMTRDDVAITYAFCIRASQSGEVINFARINQAILDRWSLSALEYIKTQAWKRVSV